MNSVPLVCDASPLILLAKLNRADLVLEHPRFRPVMLRCVADEIQKGPFISGEEAELRHLISCIPCEEGSRIPERSGSLSLCDLDSLDWARTRPNAWLFADDRLLRRAAAAAGVSVLGFPGLLIDQTRNGVFKHSEAAGLLDDAVSRHRYRISIQLYQKVIYTLSRV